MAKYIDAENLIAQLRKSKVFDDMGILSYNDGIQESINIIQNQMSNDIPLAMLNFRRITNAIESKANIIRAKIKDRLT